MIIGVRKIWTINEVPLLVLPPQYSVDISDTDIVRWYLIIPRKSLLDTRSIFSLQMATRGENTDMEKGQKTLICLVQALENREAVGRCCLAK